MAQRFGEVRGKRGDRRRTPILSFDDDEMEGLLESDMKRKLDFSNDLLDLSWSFESS